MLCSHCGKKDANFHYKQVENGVFKEMHLCSDCAKELGYIHEHSFGFENILSDFLSFPKHQTVAETPKGCSVCKTTYEEFKRTGLLGCEKCYDEFKNIDSILLLPFQKQLFVEE